MRRKGLFFLKKIKGKLLKGARVYNGFLFGDVDDMSSWMKRGLRCRGIWALGDSQTGKWVIRISPNSFLPAREPDEVIKLLSVWVLHELTHALGRHLHPLGELATEEADKWNIYLKRLVSWCE